MPTAAHQYDVFQAIADPTRRQLLKLLAGREMPVMDLSKHFSMSRPAVTKHLNVLSRAGLVSERKIGRERRYKLEAQALREIHQWIAFFESLWDDKLQALKNYVEKEGK